MLRQELKKTQIYLFILAGLWIINRILWANAVSPFTFGVSPGEIVSKYIFSWLLIAVIPLVWAFALYKIPKKWNILSIIFPLLILVYSFGSEAMNFARSGTLIELFYGIILISGFSIIVGFLGIFFIISETYEFKNKKRAWLFIALGLFLFIIVIFSYFFNFYGGDLSNIYLTPQDFYERGTNTEIDPLSTYSAKTLSRVYLVFNSSGISTQYINEKHEAGCSIYVFKNKFLSGQNIQKELCCVDYGVGPDFRICKSSDGNYQNLWYVSYNKTYVIDTEVVFNDGNACLYNIPENPSVSGGKTCY